MTVSIKITGIPEIQRRLRTMGSDLADRAASAALNKVGGKGKAEMNRAITDEYNIKRAEVSAKLRLSRASRNDLVVVLDPFAGGKPGRALNLIHFLDKKETVRAARKAQRAGKKGTQKIGGREMPILYFKIKKNGPAKPIPGAFLGNQGRTVFIRKGNSRVPIEALSTVGVPQMFNARKINARVMARINAELPVEFDRAIKMVTERFEK